MIKIIFQRDFGGGQPVVVRPFVTEETNLKRYTKGLKEQRD